MTTITKPIRHEFGSPPHLGHVSLPPSPLIEVVLTARVGRSLIAVSLKSCKCKNLNFMYPSFYEVITKQDRNSSKPLTCQQFEEMQHHSRTRIRVLQTFLHSILCSIFRCLDHHMPTSNPTGVCRKDS